MGEAQELQLQNMETKDPENASLAAHQSIRSGRLTHYKWWLKMTVYSFFILSGQSAATLLGRLYYDKGGKSKWMATLVQPGGFPILIPLLFFSSTKGTQNPNNPHHTNPPSPIILVSLYLFLGIFLAAVCMLYSIGLLYLPVSTYSLICASQLGFNALFSYFLNSQKLTPFIVNSIVLLTISSTLLVFTPDASDSTETSKGKYAIGFVSTIGASAGYALMLAVTQLAFQKILKSASFRVVLDMIIYQSLVATFVIVVGLFASGEWKSLNGEMMKFELGKSSYVMTLLWIAISWQVFSIGCTGLIFEISSLFSNVISTLGLPIVPVLAVFIFQDKMNGVKVVAMLLAIWGFVSYIYQHYIDDLQSKEDGKYVDQVSEATLIERS